MASTPKKLSVEAIREQRNLVRGVTLRSNGSVLPRRSFEARKAYLTAAYTSGDFLKDPEAKGKPAANPMTDPAAMEGMMGMMKSNMAMIVPQTLIMSWINAFFSGFVVLRLPFPLTPKFKSMLQSGVQTRDLDVRWVSSISLYFLCMFGLQSVFIYLLGSENGRSKAASIMFADRPAASQISQQMAQAAPTGSPFGLGVEADKQFKAEAENLQVIAHDYLLEGVEQRLLDSLESRS
jgi:hypothetical protein